MKIHSDAEGLVGSVPELASLFAALGAERPPEGPVSSRGFPKGGRGLRSVSLLSRLSRCLDKAALDVFMIHDMFTGLKLP